MTPRVKRVVDAYEANGISTPPDLLQKLGRMNDASLDDLADYWETRSVMSDRGLVEMVRDVVKRNGVGSGQDSVDGTFDSRIRGAGRILLRDDGGDLA